MITEKDVDNITESASRVEVPVDLRDILPKKFKRVPHTKFTKSDRLIMADILGLKLKKKEIVQYSLPNLRVFADAENDHRRTAKDHELKILEHQMRVDREFNYLIAPLKKQEIANESIAKIDVSEFDDQDFAILDLINKIIASADEKRDNKQKLSLNKKVREAI